MKRKTISILLSCAVIMATIFSNEIIVRADNDDITQDESVITNASTENEETQTDSSTNDDESNSNDATADDTATDDNVINNDETDKKDEESEINESDESNSNDTATDENVTNNDETDKKDEESEVNESDESLINANVTYVVYIGDEEVNYSDYISCDSLYEVGTETSLTYTVNPDYFIETFEINGSPTEYDDYDESSNVFTYNSINITESMNIEIHLISYEDFALKSDTDAADSDDKYYASLEGSDISIDGYFDDWNDKPLSYHYNWDNSQNCWNWGEWADGVCYKTEEGTYDNNVRHIIQMYEENGYIFVHIKIATIYQSGFNGEDYNFKFNDSQNAKFQITDTNGESLTNAVNNMNPGIYNIQVRHGDGSCSFQLAEASAACLKIYDNHKNTEIEFAIPIYECNRQNSNIDMENVESITFFTPNLMYTSIQSHGTPTYPIPLAIICISMIVIGNVYIIRKKRNKKVSP